MTPGITPLNAEYMQIALTNFRKRLNALLTLLAFVGLSSLGLSCHGSSPKSATETAASREDVCRTCKSNSASIFASLDTSRSIAYCKREAETNQQLIEGATGFQGWALALLAGSILTILGDGYLKPVQWQWRLIYILFLPAWFYSGRVFFYYDDLLEAKYNTLLFAPRASEVHSAGCDAAFAYGGLRDCFQASLYYYGAWLTAMLILFLFNLLKKPE